jgi:ribosomal protein S17E
MNSKEIITIKDCNGKMGLIKSMAIEFVNKYPNLFTEDREFWTDEINKIMVSAVILFNK